MPFFSPQKRWPRGSGVKIPLPLESLSWLGGDNALFELFTVLSQIHVVEDMLHCSKLFDIKTDDNGISSINVLYSIDIVERLTVPEIRTEHLISYFHILSTGGTSLEDQMILNPIVRVRSYRVQATILIVEKQFRRSPVRPTHIRTGVIVLHLERQDMPRRSHCC